MSRQQRWFPYAVAIGATAMALWLRLQLTDAMAESLGTFFYLAVIVSAWYGGFKPGIVAIGLSTLAIDFWLIPPLYQLGIARPGDAVQLGSFILVALIIHLLTNYLQESKRQIAQLSQRLAQINADRLQAALQEAETGKRLLQQQFEQQRLIMEMTQCIRQSLSLPDILQATANEVRRFLQTDRVIIFQFFPDWRGVVTLESCGEAWTSILATEIYDPCFQEQYVEPFRQGLVTAKSDIQSAGLDACHLELLSHFQVRANLVVPLLQTDRLWGLLIAHHCAAPRDWQEAEIDLLRQIATQVSIALQQAALFGQIHQELEERKQIEAALQKSQTQLHRQLAEIETIYQSAPIGLSVLDLHLRFVRINQQFAQMNGLPVELHLGFRIRELFPALATQIEPLLERVLETGEPLLNVELTGETPAQMGVQRTWLESFLPLKDGDDLIGISIVCEEITERKQAEIKLQQAKQELERRVMERTAELTEVNNRLLDALIRQKQTQQVLAEQAQLLDLAHNTIMTLDLNLVITFWNQGAELMYGWTKAEALGTVSNQLLKTQFPRPFAEIEADLLANGYWEGELIHRNRDDRTLTVLSRWVLQRDHTGQPIKILEINNDITERKQAELALRESEERRRLALDLTHTGCWDWDVLKDTAILDENAFSLLGLPSDQGTPRYAAWRQRIHPDDLERVEQTYFAAIMAHTDYATEYRVVHPNGAVRWLMVRARGVYDETGQIQRVIGVLLDITERQRIEQMKNEFIGIVSHELRTPLMAIQMSLGLLKTGIYDQRPEKFRRMIEIALIDTNRLVNLVNDILDLERLEAGRAILEKTLCRADDLMQQAVDGIQTIATPQQITLTVLPSPLEVWVAADSIIQTLTNLLSNAIKFSPPQSTIWLSAEFWENQALFRVQDQGRGIPADKLESIFGRFQQVDASDSREKGGTGLGLPICRSIIEQHGGRIWAESTLGQGSTFYFTLPLSPNTAYEQSNHFSRG